MSKKLEVLIDLIKRSNTNNDYIFAVPDKEATIKFHKSSDIVLDDVIEKQIQNKEVTIILRVIKTPRVLPINENDLIIAAGQCQRIFLDQNNLLESVYILPKESILFIFNNESLDSACTLYKTVTQ